MRTWRCPRGPNRTVRHHLMIHIQEHPQWVCLPLIQKVDIVLSGKPVLLAVWVFVFRWVPTWNRNVVISPPLTHSSLAPLMRSSTPSFRMAASATMVSPLDRRRAATETHGMTRWRATRGCTTSRRFPWRKPCYLRTETNWRWSTAGRTPCPHSAACCRNSTGLCLYPSEPVLIQRQEGNPAASHCLGTAGCMQYWPPLLLHRIKESHSTTTWTGPETRVRHSLHVHH